jgi:hypothetical protein
MTRAASPQQDPAFVDAVGLGLGQDGLHLLDQIDRWEQRPPAVLVKALQHPHPKHRSWGRSPDTQPTAEVERAP